MTAPLLQSRDARGVVTLTLNRPGRHNAMDAALIAALTEAVEALGGDAGVRVVVLTGAGASFCAGADLDWMQAQFAADRATRMAEARRLATMLRALNTLPKPLIARVNGAAYGGGLGLLAVADIAVAADTARFGLTETRLGLIPATISPYVFTRIGEGMARRIALSARLFGAAEAERVGIIARAVPADDLDAAVEAEVAPCLAAGPAAMAATKALARRLGPVIDDALIETTIAALADTWDGAEAQEGVTAFLEKRPPRWRGGAG